MAEFSKLNMVVKDRKLALAKYLNWLLHVFKVGFVIIITGGPAMKIGTGKTWTAAAIAEQVELYGNRHYGTKTQFTADKFAFLLSDFVGENGIMARIEADFEEGKYGQVAVLDEAEINAASDTHYLKGNKVLADTIRTFRELRCMAIFIAPTFADIDKRLRKLCALWGYPEIHIDKNGKKVCYLRIYQIRTDNWGEEIRLRSLVFYDANEKKLVKMEKMLIDPPSKEVIEPIDIKGHIMKKKLRAKTSREVVSYENDLFGENKGVYNLQDSVAKAFTNPDIMRRLEQGHKVSTRNIQLLYKEGKDKELEFPDINRNLAGDIAAELNERYGIKRVARK